MKIRTITTALAAAVLASVAPADEDADLVVEGETLITRAPAPAHVENLTEVLSGWLFRSDETQALQTDDFDNPGMIFVDQALDTWDEVDGAAGKACASCHEDPSSLAGVRTTMPKVNEDGELWAMEDYVNDCRTTRMEAEPWKWESQDMLNMTALVSLQSRGMPMNVAIDGPAQSYWEQGKEMYYTRYGQLDMACANCHEDNYGNMIRADHLSQGQINGFPVYRLKWAGLGSIHRRFKGCMENIRAEPFKRGSDEFTALELYLASRGEGLSVEGPSVRN